MAEAKSAADETEISRHRFAELLNEDLSREYQAIIAYVVYSQVLTGALFLAAAVLRLGVGFIRAAQRTAR
jgi:bacterioferritin